MLENIGHSEAGDNIGALLRGVERTDVERGQVLAKPGSVTPHTEFEAQAYVLKKEEGGRHTPFFTKYRPQFILELQTLQVKSNFHQERKWLCQEMMPSLQ